MKNNIKPTNPWIVILVFFFSHTLFSQSNLQLEVIKELHAERLLYRKSLGIKNTINYPIFVDNIRKSANHHANYIVLNDNILSHFEDLPISGIEQLYSLNERCDKYGWSVKGKRLVDISEVIAQIIGDTAVQSFQQMNDTEKAKKIVALFKKSKPHYESLMMFADDDDPAAVTVYVGYGTAIQYNKTLLKGSSSCTIVICIALYQIIQPNTF